MHRKPRHTPLPERRTVSGGIDRRRHPRYGTALKVRVLTRERATICFTRSISHDGFFLAAEEPVREHRIIRMRIELPDQVDELEALGVVRWRRGRAEGLKTGASAGMGVSFYQMAPEVKQRWVELIADHEDCLQFEPFDVREEPPEPEPMEEPRRRQARVERSLTVSFSHKGRIFQHVTEDVSLSGFFVPCSETVPLGSRLTFTLFSTATLEAIQVRGEIVRVDEGIHGHPGIGVEIFRYVEGTKDDLLRIIGPTEEERGFGEPDLSRPRMPIVEEAPQKPEVPSERSDSFDLEIDYADVLEAVEAADAEVLPLRTDAEPDEDDECDPLSLGLAETVEADFSNIREHLVTLRSALR